MHRCPKADKLKNMFFPRIIKLTTCAMEFHILKYFVRTMPFTVLNMYTKLHLEYNAAS